MLQIMLRCFARGFFSLLNHNEKTSCQNHRHCKLGKVRQGLYKVWRKRHRPRKGSGTCQKFREEKGCPHCHLVRDQNPIHAKRAFLPFLMQLRQPVWLGFVSCWKPAAGKPAQREKASHCIYLFISLSPV